MISAPSVRKTSCNRLMVGMRVSILPTDGCYIGLFFLMNKLKTQTHTQSKDKTNFKIVKKKKQKQYSFVRGRSGPDERGVTPRSILPG